MRNTYLKDVRAEFSDSRYAIGVLVFNILSFVIWLSHHCQELAMDSTELLHRDSGQHAALFAPLPIFLAQPLAQKSLLNIRQHLLWQNENHGQSSWYHPR